MADELLTRAVHAAVDAFENTVERAGGEVVEVVVIAHVQGAGSDGVCAGKGLADDHEILGFLLLNATAVAHELGIDLRTFPVDVGQG